VLGPLRRQEATAILPFQYRRLGDADRIVVEACPASTLRLLGLPNQNYKQPEAGPLTHRPRVTRNVHPARLPRAGAPPPPTRGGPCPTTPAATPSTLCSRPWAVGIPGKPPTTVSSPTTPGTRARAGSTSEGRYNPQGGEEPDHDGSNVAFLHRPGADPRLPPW